MYSKIFLIIACLVVFYYALYKLVAYLKKNNQASAADSIKDIADKLSNGVVDNFIPNDNLKRIISQFPELFKDKKYFNNFDDLLKIIADFLPLRHEVSPFFPGFKGRVVVTDDDDHPLQLTQAMLETTKKIVAEASTEEDKAKAIFEWFEANIVYGEKRRGEVGYRSSSEVFNTAEGVCGEMAILFMVMGRVVGLKADYALVDKDYKGDKVNHACVAVNLSRKIILIDPAYHTFNILHHSYKVLSDEELVNRFKSYRAN